MNSSQWGWSIQCSSSLVHLCDVIGNRVLSFSWGGGGLEQWQEPPLLWKSLRIPWPTTYREISLGFCLKNYDFWEQHDSFMGSTSIQAFLYLNLLVTFVDFYMVPPNGFVWSNLLIHTFYPLTALWMFPDLASTFISCFSIFYPKSFHCPQPFITAFFFPSSCRCWLQF